MSDDTAGMEGSPLVEVPATNGRIVVPMLTPGFTVKSRQPAEVPADEGTLRERVIEILSDDENFTYSGGEMVFQEGYAADALLPLFAAESQKARAEALAEASGWDQQ